MPVTPALRTDVNADRLGTKTTWILNWVTPHVLKTLAFNQIQALSVH